MRKLAAIAFAAGMILSCSAAGESRHPAAPVPPPFTLPGVDGRQHQLQEWAGKVVLLNFWASWCSPCQTEIRDLVAWQERYGARGLQIVGIGMDDESRLRNVHRSLGINYPLLFASKSAPGLAEAFGNRTGVVPYSVLISRAGAVVYSHAGVITSEIFETQVLPSLQ